jgi:hypothetical protein
MKPTSCLSGFTGSLAFLGLLGGCDSNGAKVDGGACPAGQVLHYPMPGCGAAAKPICGPRTEDACLRVGCGCSGNLIEGCDYFGEPWYAHATLVEGGSFVCPGLADGAVDGLVVLGNDGPAAPGVDAPATPDIQPDATTPAGADVRDAVEDLAVTDVANSCPKATTNDAGFVEACPCTRAPEDPSGTSCGNVGQVCSYEPSGCWIVSCFCEATDAGAQWSCGQLLC